MPLSTSTILYLAHGGGPLPLLGDPNHQEMVSVLKKMTQQIPKPSAIIIISAHWEVSQVNITAGSQPELIYDYYGFPKESYSIQYPASGAPDLAKQVQHELNGVGITSQLNTQRGYDHGMFVPLKMMYPEADIPTIQVSLQSSLDPAEHIQIGKGLAELEQDNLLIIGSGLSFHNLKTFFNASSDEEQRANQGFETWLQQVMTDTHMTEATREKRLVQWEQAPGARFCHPREEHLLPLHVCYGAAGTAARESYHFQLYDKAVSCYLWQK